VPGGTRNGVATFTHATRRPRGSYSGTVASQSDWDLDGVLE
jgi:hypothetical protein